MARENIPTWTISCYTQRTTSQFRSRVASLSHWRRGRGRGRPTCGGGFLPLPEEDEENIVGVDDSGQEEQVKLCHPVSTHGRCWFVV